MRRILATSCNDAPAIASNLFVEVANGSASHHHLEDFFCFFRIVIFAVELCEEDIAEDFGEEDAVDLRFAIAPVTACDLFVRTCVAGARCTG